MSFNFFYSRIVFIVKIYLLSLAIFFLFRFIPVFYLEDLSALKPEIHNLFKSLWYGFRFDTLVSCYLLLPLFFISLPLTFVKPDSAYGRISGKIISGYSIVCLMVIFFILTVDFYYYKFFHAHFDSMFFGIIEDDTRAVLKSVWTDNPVILIILVLTLLTLGIRWLIRRMIKKIYQFPISNFIVKTAFVLVLFGLFALGMRSSLGTFPLGKDDMIICDNTFINDITPNGIFYLKETLSDRSRYKIDTQIEPILQKYQFTSTEEAVKEYTGIDKMSGDLLSSLETQTPADTFLENNPPNVVFIMMESMGAHYLTLHTPNLNLLGALEGELKNCIVFTDFYPCANGTILSFEGILINSPSTPVSQSQYSKVPLKSSVALPYLKAGYETSYLTGGKLGWRKMGIYTLNQYFNAAEGNTEILEKVPGSSESTWGVYDQYLFKRIADKLKEDNSKGKPSFIYALTVSNHTPFELPESYKAYPVKLTDDIKKRIKTSNEIAVKNFTAYQYSNNYLGEFIRQIRESDLGKNTIIAVTGDHNCRQLFEYSDQEMHYHYSVPLILYVPDAYLAHAHIDTTRIGSHKDIFPTLYNLSLSAATYVKSGNNLLTPDTTTHFFGVNGYNLGFDKNGAVIADAHLYFKWIPGTRLLEPANAAEEGGELFRLTRSQSFCMDYYVRSQLKISTKKE